MDKLFNMRIKAWHNLAKCWHYFTFSELIAGCIDGEVIRYEQWQKCPEEEWPPNEQE